MYGHERVNQVSVLLFPLPTNPVEGPQSQGVSAGIEERKQSDPERRPEGYDPDPERYG